MKDLIRRIIKEESTEKEIIDDFKKLINYFEPYVYRKLFLSPFESGFREKLGGSTTTLSNQQLEPKYPGYHIQFEVVEETDEKNEILYYYLVDKDGNDIFKYSRYI